MSPRIIFWALALTLILAGPFQEMGLKLFVQSEK